MLSNRFFQRLIPFLIFWQTLRLVLVEAWKLANATFSKQQIKTSAPWLLEAGSQPIRYKLLISASPGHFCEQCASWVVLFSFRDCCREWVSSVVVCESCDPPVGGCGEDGEDDVPAMHADDGTGGMQEVEVEMRISWDGAVQASFQK